MHTLKICIRTRRPSQLEAPFSSCWGSMLSRVLNASNQTGRIEVVASVTASGNWSLTI